MMDTPYIDIHSHRSAKPDHDLIRVTNVSISKEYIADTICTVGIHPWYIDHAIEPQKDTLEKYIQKENVIAVGECGLDKMYGAKPELQQQIFEYQIQLANTHNKPLIIHCVRAYSEVFATLKTMRNNVPVIFHGFNKNAELALQLIHHGYYISLGQHIVSGKHNELIQQIPLDRIFFETDDKSISVKDIYAYFCRARKLDLNVLIQQVHQNYLRIF